MKADLFSQNTIFKLTPVELKDGLCLQQWIKGRVSFFSMYVER